MDAVKLVAEWKPPEDQSIGVVSCNYTQVVCASRCDIFYLEIEECKLTLKR